MSLRDRLTIDRIEFLVDDADYPSAKDAVDDSWRVALLASLPKAARGREAARLAAVRAANERRAPGARPVRAATHGHRVLYIFALVVGMLAVALVALPPRGGGPALGPQEGMLLAGALAVVAVAILAWLEPLRATGALWGSHAPAVMYLFFAALWLLFAASFVVFRWADVDRHEPLPVIAGLLLFGIAGATSLFLWRRGLRADREQKQTGRGFVTRDLIDQSDAAEVFTALDAWWGVEGRSAYERNPIGIRETRTTVLGYLRATMLVTDREARAALRTATPPEWKERR